MKKKRYWDMYLGREYGVLPRWMQFIIFIHSGLFRGGGGKWRWAKLKRIHCWRGNHKDIWKYPLKGIGSCRICGEQSQELLQTNQE